MSRLLLAIDLYDPQPGLVDQAAAWARRVGARLDVLHVGPYGQIARMNLDPLVHRMLLAAVEENRREDRARLAEIVEGLPAELRGESIVTEGNPADQIVQRQDGYDAILIGTHGRRGLTHAVLGSVAERVVRLATVPVMVLRPHR